MREVKREEIGKKKPENLINECILMIEKQLGCKIPDTLLSCQRLRNHIHDMILRCMQEEKLKSSINEEIIEQYRPSYKIACYLYEEVEKQLQKKPDIKEIGYLAIHIQRCMEEMMAEKEETE